MDYRLTTLSNGLRVITVPMPNLESVSITLWVGVGSRFEEDGKAGVSHFLEHVVSKGSKKYKTARAISLATDSIGAETNAGTSHEWTDFYIKSQAGQVRRSFDLLADMVLNPLLRENDIEREKGVILEEISMHKDNPMERIGDIFTNLTFAGSSLGRDIIGSVDTVKGILKNDFEKYRDIHYKAKNMILTVAGKIDEEKILKLANKYFGNLEEGKKEEARKFEQNADRPRVKVEYKDTEQAHLILGFYGYNRTHPERLAEGLLSVILGKGMSSRLFTEIREKRGLAYAVGTSVSRFVDTGVFGTYAGINPKNISKVVKLILNESYGIAEGKYPITLKELNKAKEFVKGRTALTLEDTLEVNEFFGQRAMFLPEIDTPEEFFKKVDAVELKNIQKVARDIFTPMKLNLAIIGPYKDSENFKKLVS